MRRRTLVTSLLAVPAAAALAGSPAHASASTFPEVIDLPKGWNPEGIAIRGTDFYVSSLATGGIYKGSLLTGDGRVLVGQGPGSQAVGLEIDWRGRIWAAGGGGGGATAYDSRTGAQLATYEFGGNFVNDAITTPDGVYFTDSYKPQLYFVPLGHGRLPSQSAVRFIELPGELGEENAFNNGIEVTPDGNLLIVQMLANRLLRFHPRSGSLTQVNLNGASVLQGDGVVRRGQTLYIVRNFFNVINKFRLNSDYTSATLVKEITDSRFTIPATADLFGPYLYAVNARFDIEPTPDTTFNIIRVPA